MGIRGLTTFMNRNISTYFEIYELKDTVIIIDGAAFIKFIYQHSENHTGAFLGNYDVISRNSIDYINLLLCRNIKPIFVFDGGLEQRKMSTILGRMSENVQLFGRESMPYFASGVFFNILNEMEIPHMNCDLEADLEIVALAKLFNCPIVSLDSDFYINTVPFIPLNKIQFNLKSTKNVIYCRIYKVEKLLHEFGGLETDYLPLLAAMLGNDYIRPDTFSTLLKIKPGTFNIHLKLERITEWLRSQTNVISAIDNMTNYLFQGRSYIKKQIKKLVYEYSKNINGRYLPFIFQYKMMSKYRYILRFKLNSDDKTTLPYWLEQNYRKGTVSAEVMTILKLKRVVFKIQIENYKSSPYYEISFKIVERILGLLFEKNVSVFGIGRNKKLDIYHFYVKPYKYNPYVPLAVLNKTNLEYRKNIILNLIGVKDFNGVPKEWELFILVVIYWIIHTNNYNTSQMHALIVSAITMNIIKKKETRSQNNIMVQNCADKADSIIEESIIKVKKEDCIKAMTDLKKYFQFNDHCDTKFYYKITHLFAQFQCCINYFMILNSLLDFPYDRCRVEHFFNGPFIYNLCVNMENCNPEAFVSELFDSDLDSLYRVYISIINSIAYILESISENKRKQLRSRRK